MKRERLLSLCLASLLALSLAACNGPTDEENSAQPTPSVQPTPTAAPTPTPEPTPPIPFTDVTQDSPYYDVLVWAYEKGIASDGETFKPGDPCTRGQAMTFLWRAMGSPEPRTAGSPFSDVSSDDWFCKPALWAYEKGVTAGTAFNPGSSCTNGEALTFLWRAQGSPLVLASSDAYYARPLAWAENNGLFAGQDAPFDPDAPCSRGDLMTYLYWAVEEWTFPEEDKTMQAEYEKILHDTTPFTSYSPGLLYADYVDVDNDGKVELLTLSTSGAIDDYPTYNVSATVYANIGGHAEKLCEHTFLMEWHEETLAICKNGGQICLHDTVYMTGTSSVSESFYKIDGNSFTLADSVEVSYISQEPEYIGMSESEYNALSQKYTDSRNILSYDRNNGISVKENGIVPTQEEYDAYWENYWTEYWASADPMYAAVVNGDFSAFAGSYEDKSGWAGDLELSKDGVATNPNGYMTGQKPISVTVHQDGSIWCNVGLVDEIGPDGVLRRSLERYIIYPVGIPDGGDPNNPDYQSDPTKVRIEYCWPSSLSVYSKVS